MYVGRRVAKLRAAHGESLREAAIRTGVSHTTIARIEKGEITSSFHNTLHKIAEGYGVRVEFLLSGRDPRRDFELFLRRLPDHERSKLYFISLPARIRLLVQFLAVEYPDEFGDTELARALGYEPQLFPELLDRLENRPTADLSAIAEALARLTGIPATWLRTGALAEDSSFQQAAESWGSYLPVIRKAAQAQIQPRLLEMAIDLLIMKNRDNSTARGA